MKSQIEHIFNNLSNTHITTFYRPKNLKYINIDINTNRIVINSENIDILNNIVSDLKSDKNETYKELLLKLLEDFPQEENNKEIKISVLEPSYLRLLKNIILIPFACCFMNQH